MILMWDKVFRNGPSKICGRHPLKNLKGYGMLKHNVILRISAEAIVFANLNVSKHFCHRCPNIQDFVIITNIFTIKIAKDSDIPNCRKKFCIKAFRYFIWYYTSIYCTD